MYFYMMKCYSLTGIKLEPIAKYTLVIFKASETDLDRLEI